MYRYGACTCIRGGCTCVVALLLLMYRGSFQTPPYPRHASLTHRPQFSRVPLTLTLLIPTHPRDIHHGKIRKHPRKRLALGRQHINPKTGRDDYVALTAHLDTIRYIFHGIVNGPLVEEVGGGGPLGTTTTTDDVVGVYRPRSCRVPRRRGDR